MSEPTVTGWGLRNRLTGAIKRRFRSVSLGKEERALFDRAEKFQLEVQRIKLDTEHTIDVLVRTLVHQILSSLLKAMPDNQGVSETEISELAFFDHLCAVMKRFFEDEKLFELPTAFLPERSVNTAELWEAEKELQRKEQMLADFDPVFHRLGLMFFNAVEPLAEACPDLLTRRSDSSIEDSSEKTIERSVNGSGELAFTAPLVMMINDFPEVAEKILTLINIPEIKQDGTAERLADRLDHNLIVASGGMPGDPNTWPKTPRLPTSSPFANNPEKLVATYFDGTIWQHLFNYSVPVAIPHKTRFEHHHIVAGSGHGKTQTIQQLILHDLQSVIDGGASVVVIDSQGELINNISNLAIFAPGSPLFERLIVIDPTDVDYPVALNLFDVNMDRIKTYSKLQQEKMINGTLELYDFVLGSLLSAEMTQKQSVIFRYITRLMIKIPNATISTFRELLEEGGADKYREQIGQLQGSARAFFETEFDSKEFSQTKKQILRRLWGILENQSFERMFLHPRNKLNLFTELNSGKIILINTAKDLLKKDGTEIFGRFFIAMIAQAAQERSVIDGDDRMPTYVYIDEAADYFDQNIGIILSQARKYKVGMILAHQFLGQMDNKLQEAVFTNTSIRFAGGVSSKDARALANEMKTEASFIENQNKLSLAAYVRGTTKQSISISIRPGQMESMATMTKSQKDQQKAHMREHYCVHYTEAQEKSWAKDEDVDADQNTGSGNSNDPKYPDEPGSW